MADDTNPPEPSKSNVVSQTWGTVSKILSAVWLTFLYSIFGLLVVFSFSAYQLQFAIQSTQTEGNEPLGLWSVLQMNVDWQSSNGQISEVAESIKSKKFLLRTLKTQRQLARSKRIMANSECATRLLKFHRQYLSDYIIYVQRKYQCDDDYFRQLKTAAKERLKDYDSNKAIQADLNDISEKFGYFVAATGDENSALEKITTVEAEIKLDEDSSKAEHDKIVTLLNGKNSSQSVGDFLNSLVYLESIERVSIVGFNLPDFTKMPPDMLTIILVMAMGAIGGTIHLTQILLYGARSTEDGPSAHDTASYFLFRPFLGSITALSVFILAKAGVLIISIPAPGGEGARISPYFISFLGIVSGLLAEQALSTIQGAGKRWFSGAEKDAISRWAYKLKEVIEEDMKVRLAKETVTDEEISGGIDLLAKALDVQSGKIRGWLELKESVPAMYQRLISLYFRRHPREIFTDIPE
jgi:hypothetical protein